jgi:hypothetical protein
MNYEEVVNALKDEERPSLYVFINAGKNDFYFFGSLYGCGWVLQAIEIAEELAKLKGEKNV